MKSETKLLLQLWLFCLAALLGYQAVLAQTILPSQTSKKFAYFQIKGVYEVPEKKLTGARKTYLVNPNPVKDKMLLNFFSENLNLIPNDSRVQALEKQILELGKFKVIDENTIGISLPTKHPANRCLEVFPKCEGFPFAKFKEVFSKIFGLTPRFSFNGSHSQYKGIWEIQDITLSMLKTSNGKVGLNPGEPIANSAINSEYNILPYLSFETANEGQDKVLAINAFFKGFGKTVMISKQNKIAACYFYDDNFKTIKFEKHFNQELENLIANYEEHFVDLPQEIQSYLTEDALEFWETCK